LVILIVLCGLSAIGRAQTAVGQPNPESQTAIHQTSEPQTPGPQTPGPQTFDSLAGGGIAGTIVGSNGEPIKGARVRLARGAAPEQESVSDDYGRFSFANVAPGDFKLTITATGLVTQTRSGTLRSGEAYLSPEITLAVAPVTTDVRVTMTRTEIAEEQIQLQEKQRVLGFIPNFYVSYVPDAVPLTSKQKFELAWKTNLDPVTFAIAGGVAGVEQWQNNFAGYGQGAQGYAKRFGAAYADSFTSTMIGGWMLPSLLKQDPRYFYKGTGSVRSRTLYALANAVMCKGDNGKWQVNYSGILGGLASGGISDLYYPASDRGAALLFENALIGIGTSAAENVIQEFLVRKLTPHLPSFAPGASGEKSADKGD
jgi:hypothetical protein